MAPSPAQMRTPAQDSSISEERAAENSTIEGIKIASELLIELRDIVQGVYLMPPFGRYDLAAEIIDLVRVQV